MKSLINPNKIIRSGLCIGCGSCVSQSAEYSQGLKMGFDRYGQLKPYGPTNWITRPTESFSQTCPFSPVAADEDQLAANLFPLARRHHLSSGRFISAYAGYVEEENYRVIGSSGGMATWLASELIRRKLIDGVAHVIAAEDPAVAGRFFKYRISRSIAEVREGAKSRYYPVEMSEILNTIREVPGRYAVVGIPCFIKAVQLLISREQVFRERIVFTLGLFCGHMKSARFVESFAWQMKASLDEIQEVEFRSKNTQRPAREYNASLKLKAGYNVDRNWWDLVDGDWGAGFFMNPACNFCDDVVAETADISFGDAWVEPYSSDSMGNNVIIIRSQALGSIIDLARQEGRLILTEVDGDFIEKTQAAGLRQRREGLSYRLARRREGVEPVKRVKPGCRMIKRSRRLIYWFRFRISAWSHRMFWIARRVGYPPLYLFWARLTAAIYHGITYHNADPKEIWKRFSQFGR